MTKKVDANYDNKISDIEGKIPDITNLGTTAALTAVENKIPKVSDLVKNADCDAKMSEIEKKIFTASDYNKLTNNRLDVKITEKKIVNESGLNEKIKTLATKEEIKTKAELKAEQDKIVKL